MSVQLSLVALGTLFGPRFECVQPSLGSSTPNGPGPDAMEVWELSLRSSRRALRRAAPPSAPHAPLRPPHSAPSRRSASPFALCAFAL